jgi:TP901 family phage tail tape measure protein
MPSLDVAINALRAEHGAKKFDAAVKKIKKGASQVDSSLEKNSKTFSNFSSQLQNVVVGFAGIAGAYKAFGFFKEGIQLAAAYELELANVNTMLDEQTAHYLPQFERELSNLAVRYGESTTSLTKGLYDILSASIDASKATKVLEVSIKSATGGMTSAAIAADALTTIINSYGLEAEQAEHVSDILFNTVKGGKITFEEIASSVGKVSALAASAGLTMEELSASIATMTRAGLQSDIAMTSLKAILTAFLSPTKESALAAKNLGFELNTTTLQTIGLIGVMEKLKSATSEEVAAIFSNVRALTGVAAMRQNVTGLIRDQERALKSLGATQEAFNKIDRTTNQQLEQTSELIKQVKRDIGNELIPTLNLWAIGFQKLVEDWKRGWWSIEEEQRKAMEKINENIGGLKYARLIPAYVLLEGGIRKVMGSNLEFTSSLIEADEAIQKLDNSSKLLGETLTKLENKTVKVDVIQPDAIKPFVVTDEIKDARKEINNLLKEIEVEKELIGLTTEERERAIKVMEFEKQAKIALGENSQQAVEMYKNELIAMGEAYKEAARNEEFAKNIEDSMRAMIHAPIEALFDESQDIEDVLKNHLRSLGQSILEQMYKDVITDPLMNSIKAGVQPAMKEVMSMITNALSSAAGGITQGIGSFVGMAVSALFGGFGGGGAAVAAGQGDVFSGRMLKRFGKGGVLNRPTLFPMSNGGLGLGGEAGDEGLLPLGRDSRGRLGVRSTNGGENKSNIKIINIVDKSQFSEYLNSGDGERTIVNIMNRNKSSQEFSG